MTEGENTPKRSRITKARKYASELRLVGGAYIGLERKLKEAKLDPVPQEVLSAYEENRETIGQIFGNEKPNEALFHGTGNLQYAGNKYSGGTGEELRHPLDSILEDGIIPHLDVWNSEKGGYESSSLATTWPYARVYADFHQNPKDLRKWEYGDKGHWLSYFMGGTTAVYGKDFFKRGVRSPKKVLREFKDAISGMRQNKSPDGVGRLHNWVSNVRRVDPSENTRQVFYSRTDIPDNFGAVFVVDKKGVKVAPKGPGVYEVRTLDPIPPENFSALTVPLDKVAEYREKVAALGYAFPVLPTEAVDYHMSRFPFEELTKNRRIPLKQK